MLNKYTMNFLLQLKTNIYNSIKHLWFWRDFIFVLIMLLFINPKFSFMNQLFFISLCILWFCFATYCNKKRILDILKSKLFILFCLFPLISILYWLCGYALINKHVLLMPFILLLSQYYLYEDYKKNLSVILSFVFLYLFLISFITLIKLYSTPDLARLLARGDKEVISSIITPFTATYATTYSICLIGIVIFSIGIYLNKIFMKVSCILVTLYIFFFLFKAAYTISLLIYIFGILLIGCAYLWNYIKNKRRAFWIILLTAVALLVICFFARNFIADTILSLQKFAPDIMQQRRIQEIARLVRNFGLENEGGMINRFNLYFLSILTFIRNPILGVGFKEEYLYTSENVLIPLIGNHSTIFDILASYGIFGLFYIISIPIYYCSLIKNKAFNNLSILKITLLLFIILSLINTTENIMFYCAIIFIIPAMIYILPNYKKEKNI